MNEYNLTFYEALEALLEHGTMIRGADFAPGYFLKLSKHGSILAVDATNLYWEGGYIVNSMNTGQMYKILDVANIASLDMD